MIFGWQIRRFEEARFKGVTKVKFLRIARRKRRHFGETQEWLHGEKAERLGDSFAIQVQKSPEVFVRALVGEQPILRSLPSKLTPRISSAALQSKAQAVAFQLLGLPICALHRSPDLP